MQLFARNAAKKFSGLTFMSVAAVLSLAGCSGTMNAHDANMTPLSEPTEETGPVIDDGGFDTPEDGEEAEVVFINTAAPGVDVTVTYTVMGNEVLQQLTENVIEYEASGLGSKAEAQEIVEPMVERSQDIEGYEYVTDYGDTTMTEEVLIDYTTLDWEAMSQVPGYEVPEEISSGEVALTVQDIRMMHESMGYEEVAQ